MTIDDKIRDENLQYDINKETAKISVLSSGKINKYQFLIGKKIFPPDQSWRTLCIYIHIYTYIYIYIYIYTIFHKC